jgi:DNA polymerase-3 subunit epsilon
VAAVCAARLACRFLAVGGEGGDWMLRLSERETTIEWARGLMDDPRTVYLDTETTGLGDDDEVVDLAVVGWDGTVLIDTLVRPKRQIPPDATNIHHLTDHDVRFAPSWCEVYPRLCNTIAGKRVVVYNAAYDFKIISGCCRHDGLPMPLAPWDCAMHAYARYRGEVNRRSGQFRWHKLEHACQAFGISAGGHRALGDAHACRAVVAAMAG